ncbi:MAG: cell division protein FtsZ, partial [Bacteroidota bacterium]
SLVPNKIQLGPHLTQGLGAGADPSVGKLATEESLEEIRKILEVNTRMAFITVGMGGGTGTGGAPIIAKICKDLGILTVGIVTTPFGFEGPRRQKQAEEGINQLKPFVDTLLVISNDKLRVQYGNLKMKEAFTKADNVLATAAKCITDVINSRGHIIVDFADVCTVMKNGGVAILGKAEVEGENRAERAIEEALNSPLLNDNDIKGAKWILLNINSAEGDYECSDVIMGMGYDPTLGQKLGITLIATGFEHKDPFKKEEPKKAEQPVEEKIVMTLETEAPIAPESIAPEAPTAELAETLILEEENEEVFEDEVVAEEISTPIEMELGDELQPTMHEYHEEVIESPVSAVFVSVPELDEAEPVMEEQEIEEEEVYELNMESSSVDFTTEFVLQKPSNIYEETSELDAIVSSVEETPQVEEPAPSFTFEFDEVETEPSFEVEPEPIAEPIMETSFRMVEHIEEESGMQLVMKEVELTNNARPAHQDFDMPIDNAEEQRRKVAERIQKLRNLSFNINNGADPNTEFDAVPAYVRRNLDLFGNTMASVENYYSKYTVDQDENNQTNISTINSFLDGKKPD